MTHCVYLAYRDHLRRRWGVEVTSRDLSIYWNVRKVTGHKDSESTFGGVVPVMMKWMAAGHKLWTVVQYQVFYSKDALLQEAIEEYGVVAWALTKLAPNGSTWDEIGLRPAIYFTPGHAYDANRNRGGKATTMAIQLRRL